VNTSFYIATSDRVAGKTLAAVTFSSTSTAGGALSVGSNITLAFPSGFFASTATPTAAFSGDGPPTIVPLPQPHRHKDQSSSQ
jgi:hypothetical protein